MILPRYPIYVPSRDRVDVCTTPKFLARDGVPFRLVVVPSQFDQYAARFGEANVLALPDDSYRLVESRCWIKRHATTEGHERHWQLDDNIRMVRRRWKLRRIRCASGVAFRAVEDFTDRYENVALSGIAYSMFVPNTQRIQPFYLNVHVYSCTLVLNAIPHEWRLVYNDDTDLCLQVLTAGWCTILVNAFTVDKMWTMQVKGGNTDALYRGDGRLKMARALERKWPGVVTTKRRFRRPQHVVFDAWRRFDTPLRYKPGIDPASFPAVDDYGMEMVTKREPKADSLRRLRDEAVAKTAAKSGNACQSARDDSGPETP